MTDCSFFYNEIKALGVDFFAGVPDSLLKDICAYIADQSPDGTHHITANEGGAVALASGYHLATGKAALVYMQNSGQGNAINPILSLADPDVYSIPMLLLIGWRGEPGVKDEPQHLKQGKVTLQLLDTLGIPYEVMPQTNDQLSGTLQSLTEKMYHESRPVALVVKDSSFTPYKLAAGVQNSSTLSREEAIKYIVDASQGSDIFVSTTGKTSRELYEYRDQKKQSHAQDFLTVGSMGHSSHIALGIALQKKTIQVFCLDGDGAALMHMGSMAVNAAASPKNLKHIILNNCAHDSVGGQPTVASNLSFTEIARGCGYRWAATATDVNQLTVLLQQLRQTEGPALLEVMVRPGARTDLGRPKTSPQENKAAFMDFLRL